MTMALFGDVIGAMGAITLLTAYAYQTFGRGGADLLYYALNLIGAILLGISLTIHVNIASLALEIAWGLIAIAGLIRQFKARRS
jgi:hypothetical protein